MSCRHGAVGQVVVGRRHVQQRARLLHDHQAVTGREGGGQVRRHGRRPVPTEHDQLPRLQPLEAACGRPARHYQPGWTNGVATTVPGRAVPRRSTSTAAPSPTPGGRKASAMPCPSTGEKLPLVVSPTI